MQEILSPNITRPSSPRPLDLIVLHTMEIAEKPDTAEACARYFARNEVDVSAHVCVDNNSEVRCVADAHVAWCAPGANHNGLHIEHAGFAKQAAADWDDAYSVAMLERSAVIAADWCKKHKIPTTFLLAPDLVAQKRGITTHWQVSRAFGLSSHWDPGLSFPIQEYVLEVRGIVGATNPPPLKDDNQYPTLQTGDEGWKVKQAQRLLNHAHQNIPEDGKYGIWTFRAVMGFQKHVGLKPTGAIGKATWRALWAHRYLLGDERPGH